MSEVGGEDFARKASRRRFKPDREAVVARRAWLGSKTGTGKITGQRRLVQQPGKNWSRSESAPLAQSLGSRGNNSRIRFRRHGKSLDGHGSDTEGKRELEIGAAFREDRTRSF